MVARATPKHRRLRWAGVNALLQTEADVMAELVQSVLEQPGEAAIGDILDTIAAEAKTLTGAEKTVLTVLPNDDPCWTRSEAVAVRGRRYAPPEPWWKPHLAKVVHDVACSGQPKLVFVGERRMWLASAPIVADGKMLGSLSAVTRLPEGFTQEDIGVLSALATTTVTAVRYALLAADSRRVLLAQERRRIAKEMHDGVSPTLFTISLASEACKESLGRDEDRVQATLDRIQEAACRGLEELRGCIHDLYPVHLRQGGLERALRQRVEAIDECTSIDTIFSVEGETRPLQPGKEACLYRVSQEAIANAVRHARPHSLKVALRYEPGNVELEISDDGWGFDVAEMSAHCAAGECDCSGLGNMQERVEQEGGEVTLGSDRGHGTQVLVRLPAA